MKRLHISLKVRDLDESVQFYSTLFAAEPVLNKTGFAKWRLDDPPVVFSIERSSSRTGLDHLGMDTETPEELADLEARIAAAGAPLGEQKNAVCCHSRSDKIWTRDPQDITWESFHTYEDTEDFGGDTLSKVDWTDNKAACCD